MFWTGDLSRGRFYKPDKQTGLDGCRLQDASADDLAVLAKVLAQHGPQGVTAIIYTVLQTGSASAVDPGILALVARPNGSVQGRLIRGQIASNFCAALYKLWRGDSQHPGQHGHAPTVQVQDCREALKIATGLMRDNRMVYKRTTEGYVKVDVHTPLLAALHELLIKPLQGEPLLGPAAYNGHLVFVPDHHLSLLPFAALRDASTGKYLIQQTEEGVSHAPSLEVLGRCGARCAELATPYSKQQQLPGMVILEADQGVSSDTLATAHDSMGQYRSVLQHALPEQRWALEVHQSSKDAKYDLAAALAALPTQAWVSLMAHGHVDDENLEEGAVGLAKGEPLMGRDVAQLNLSAMTAVLHVCHTMRGAVTADSVLGMAHSMLLSGVPCCMGTLWAAGMRPATFHAQRLYSHLTERLDSGERRSFGAAMKLAAQDMLASEDHSRPYHWAVFCCQGFYGVSLPE